MPSSGDCVGLLVLRAHWSLVATTVLWPISLLGGGMVTLTTDHNEALFPTTAGDLWSLLLDVRTQLLTLRVPQSDRWSFSHPRAQSSFSHNWYCCQIQQFYRLLWRLLMIKASRTVQWGRKRTQMWAERHKTREHRWEWENSNQWWKPCLEKLPESKSVRNREVSSAQG